MTKEKTKGSPLLGEFEDRVDEKLGSFEKGNGGEIVKCLSRSVLGCSGRER